MYKKLKILFLLLASMQSVHIMPMAYVRNMGRMLNCLFVCGRGSEGEYTEYQDVCALTGPFTTFACSPDGKYIASGSPDGSIKLWKNDNTLVQNIEGHSSSVNSVAFSPDSKYIVSGSNDRTIKLWKTDGTLVKTIKGHSSFVNSVAFSLDGKYIVSGSNDRTIKIWKIDDIENKTETK